MDIRIVTCLALALGILFGAMAMAQTAKVIQLSDADAAEAKSLQEQEVAIRAKQKKLQERITKKYLITEDPSAASNTTWLDPDSPTTLYSGDNFVTLCLGTACAEKTPEKTAGKKDTHQIARLKYYKMGWVYGFEFSDDFKFIVPNPISTYLGSHNGCGISDSPIYVH